MYDLNLSIKTNQRSNVHIEMSLVEELLKLVLLEHPRFGITLDHVFQLICIWEQQNYVGSSRKGYAEYTEFKSMI